MIRLAFAFLLSLCVSAQAQLSGGVGGFPGPGMPAAAAGLSIDGTANNHTTSGTTITASLTTTKTNNIIIVSYLANSPASATVSNTAGLTWTQRANSGGTFLRTYWAFSPGILTGDTITVTANTSVTFANLVVVAINGANTGAPFDLNGSLPATSTTTTVSVSTTNANTVLMGTYRCSSANPSASAPWTQVYGSNFMLVEYQIVSATQSGTSVPATGCGTVGGAIGDAVTQ